MHVYIPGSTMKGLGESLLGTLEEHSLQNMQHNPTRENNCLDLLCTNKPGIIKCINTFPGFSDHDFVVVDTVLTPVTSKKAPRKIFKWSKAHWDKMRFDTQAFTNEALSCTNLTVQGLYESFTKHMKTMLNLYVPCTWSRTRSDLPWLSPELKRQCNKKQRLYNKARKSKNPAHWAEYKCLSKENRKMLRKAHWKHLNRVLEDAEQEGNSKPFWRYIKSQRQDSVGVSPLKHKGQLHSDAKSKATILQHQFKSVFTKDTDSTERNNAPYGPNYPGIGRLHITEKGVLKLLQDINPSKAGGPDSVPGRMLKELATELTPFMTLLFRQSLDTGQVPKEWKEQWVNPIFKKGNKNDAANYRPVSLTCITSKLMEHVLCSHIRQHLDDHSILSPFQHGFRSKHSCETQLVLTTHDIAQQHDLNHQVDIAILDFSKAFDVIPHQRLLNKLSFYGIEGRCKQWIQAFLSGRKQKVVVDGSYSEDAPVESGVPQGTVLGPLLFLLFINDLPNVLSPGTRIRLFADDCLVYRVIKSVEDQVLLQNDLDRLITWADTWGMKFNASKCNIMRTMSAPFLDRFYHLHGHILKEVTSVKYLGITFQNNLSWSNHIKMVTTKASQQLGFIRRNLRGSPPKCKTRAYFSLVRSGMEYAASIWDPYLQKEIRVLEAVQRKAARWVRSQYSTTVSVTKLLTNLKWASLADRRQLQRLSLFHKINTASVAIQFSDFDIQKSSRVTRAGSKLGQDGQTVDNYKLHRPSNKRTPFGKSTIIRTIPAWNNLPWEAHTATSSTTFRSVVERLP